MNKTILIIIFVIILLGIIIFSLIKKKINIDVGLVYTTSGGSMAPYEKELYTMVNDKINIFNKNQNKYKINIKSYNPESNTEKYVSGTEKIIIDYNPALIIGVWRSIDRKSVLPIVEKYNNLLCYAVQYEGQECSKNVLYFGACTNQQIDIGIEYAIKNISKNIILIGSDYVFPRTANDIMKKYITNYNANLIMEKYVSLDETDFSSICDEILNQSNNCIIINTINGDSNKYFFKTLNMKFKSKPENKEKLRSNSFPVMSFSIPESDLQLYDIGDIYGDFHIWNYSQTDHSFDTFLHTEMVNNNRVLNKLITSFIKSDKIIGDPEYHSFLIVLFFCSFLLDYNENNYSPEYIRSKFLKYRQKVMTPTGFLKINQNNHLDNVVYILRILETGRYQTIYRSPVEIKPNPWYSKFDNIRHECNNFYDFMGIKYIDN